MDIGTRTTVQGYITVDKFLYGRSLDIVERTLGFHSGRLAKGARFLALTTLPRLDQFELAAYSMVASHRFISPEGLDINRLKQAALDYWTLIGPNRPVKVHPFIPHDDRLEPDIQYPPGLGAPQWRLIVPLPAVVVDVVMNYPSGSYRPKA